MSTQLAVSAPLDFSALLGRHIDALQVVADPLARCPKCHKVTHGEGIRVASTEQHINRREVVGCEIRLTVAAVPVVSGAVQFDQRFMYLVGNALGRLAS